MKMTVEMKTISKLKATSKMKTTSELKTTSKMEGTKKVKTFSERKETSKVKTTSKIGLPLNKICLPPSPPIKNLPDFLLMTSHPDSHTTTDVKPEIIPGVQTGNGIPHDEYDICGIAHARTNRKDNVFMQRRLYNDKLHTALDIFFFAVFLLIEVIVVDELEEVTISTAAQI